MTTNAASESALGTLHEKVAKVMTNAIAVMDKEQEAYLETEDVTDVPAPQPNASLLSVITKFLADNKITCVASESSAVSELEERLKNKTRRRVGNVTHLHTDE